MTVAVSPGEYELISGISRSFYGEHMKFMKFTIDDGARCR